MSMVKIFIEAESLNVPESKFLDSILKHIGITHDKYELMPTGGYKKPQTERINYTLTLLHCQSLKQKETRPEGVLGFGMIPVSGIWMQR